MDSSFLVLIVVAAVVIALFKALVARRDQEIGYHMTSSLLSKAERSFFGVLTQAANNNYVVFSKVRVADVMRPEKGLSKSAWQTAFNRISGKHFDFLLCDPATLKVELVVELNDTSHRRKKRAERDRFLRGACESARLPLIEIQAKRSYSVQEVREQINTANSQL